MRSKVLKFTVHKGKRLYLAAGKPPFLIEKPAEMQCDIKNKEGCDYTFKIIQILEEFMQNTTEPCVVIQ